MSPPPGVLLTGGPPGNPGKPRPTVPNDLPMLELTAVLVPGATWAGVVPPAAPAAAAGSDNVAAC